VLLDVEDRMKMPQVEKFTGLEYPAYDSMRRGSFMTMKTLLRVFNKGFSPKFLFQEKRLVEVERGEVTPEAVEGRVKMIFRKNDVREIAELTTLPEKRIKSVCSVKKATLHDAVGLIIAGYCPDEIFRPIKAKEVDYELQFKRLERRFARLEQQMIMLNTWSSCAFQTISALQLQVEELKDVIR